MEIKSDNKKTETVGGLAAILAVTPLRDVFGTVLDLRGAWTAEMFEEHDASADRPGLWIWEGECEVTTVDAGAPGEWKHYEFKGAARPLRSDEVDALARGWMPLSGRPMPGVDEDLVTGWPES